jgi:hypothetical protein
MPGHMNGLPMQQQQWAANGYAQQPPGMMNHQFPPNAQQPPLPPPVKYPMDDMELPPKNDGVCRPPLKFVVRSQCPTDADASDVIEGIEEITVGNLLEAWNTLNVYASVLKLDSFTFDDFVEALQFSSDEVDCELLVEMHCAVLKQLVYAENYQNGAIQISLPDLPDASDDEEEEEEEEPETREPTPTPEPEIPARRTRSSLNKVQNAESEEDASAPAEAAVEEIHRGAEIVDELGWIQRLRRRDFKNGSWELVLAGLLYQLSGRPRLTETCNTILTHLCPLDVEPTIESISVQYSTMNLDSRALALQTIIQLFMETKAVKDFLEDKSTQMTNLRKEKIQYQRARKEAVLKIKTLDNERKLNAPTPENTPTPEPVLEDSMDVDKIEDGDDSIPDSEEEDAIQVRSLRRGQDRAAERKRKREEEADRKAKEAENKQQKGSKEYQKILKQLDKERDNLDAAEEQIMIMDEQLRQADCTRTRVLGKDRFCNRYWWFERNAMPHAGSEQSSTADADYANARIWVQGPDDLEREGYIDVPKELQNNYASRFSVTPAERKAQEEGPTQLATANQWGFYDTPEAVDDLIKWLDPRGSREIKLKKELEVQREVIALYMQNRKLYLESNDEEAENEEPAPKRMATRKKTYIIEPLARCTRWENTLAMEVNGHKHIDPPPIKKGRGTRKGGSAGLLVESASAARKGRARSGSEVPMNGTAKRPTRQGDIIDLGPTRRSRTGRG